MSVDRQFNESDNEVNSPQYSIADQCLSMLSREQIGKSAIETGIESEDVQPKTEIEQVCGGLELLPGLGVHIGPDTIE